MCVIVYRPANAGFEEKDIRLAYENNEDGFGYMYYHSELNKIIAKKTTEHTPDKIVEIFDKLKKHTTVFHYRYKTVGAVENKQCHPFKILNRRKHGVDMYFMHNGTIQNTKQRLKGESDTQAFNRTVLRPILSKMPSLIKTEAFQHLIKEYMGAGSKLVFMYGKGQVVTINAEAGFKYLDGKTSKITDDTKFEKGSCWVSNEYSFRGGYRTNKTTTTYNGYPQNRTYGGGGVNNAYKPAANRASGATPQGKKTKEKKIEEEQRDFLGSTIKTGDKVWIYSSKNVDWYGVGTVEEFNVTCAIISLKEPNTEKDIKINVWLEDGQSYGQGSNADYYAIPGWEIDDESMSTTVGQKKAEVGGVSHSNVVPITTKGEKKDTSPASTPAKSDTKELTEPVTHKEKTVDAKYRWGGAFLEDTEECDYDGFTIKQFYNLNAQERFEWFNEDTQSAFNMLQDLAENIVIQEEEEYEDEMLDYYTNYGSYYH